MKIRLNQRMQTKVTKTSSETDTDHDMWITSSELLVNTDRDLMVCVIIYVTILT